MTLPWSAQQVEWLQAMGLDVLARPVLVPAPAATPTGIPAGLARAARGVDLAPLLAAHGAPRDPAGRRAFWQALRPLRKAAHR